MLNAFTFNSNQFNSDYLDEIFLGRDDSPEMSTDQDFLALLNEKPTMAILHSKKSSNFSRIATTALMEDTVTLMEDPSTTMGGPQYAEGDLNLMMVAAPNYGVNNRLDIPRGIR